ncbi:Uncharacterized proteins, LmbE homologs [Legionella busanensis]|uniref:Uncharacterized proteins, LmbE homologs n=1 Tax=Legionella busanensis TaxID=190655 RepID=A0A378JKY1_9GAMM|nr:PIG-L family deacetylase [Legionella busanensis]STX51391.1 Uncharacterized proteins, LmbE homologs [Legionella busanensis]
MNNRVLVIAAHPDDELLGCGGTVAKHVLQSDIVSTHIIAEGFTSRNSSNSSNSSLALLHQEAIQANHIIGVTDVHIHQFPDNKLDTISRLELIKVIEAIIDNTQPDIIYTHHIGDVNIDHRRIHEAVITATRPMPHSLKPTLLFFETQSSTEWQPIGSAPPFIPNWFVDISETLELKMRALSTYESEMRPWPHARSLQGVEYLARWRGCSAGINAAEAFLLGRKILSI